MKYPRNSKRSALIACIVSACATPSIAADYLRGAFDPSAFAAPSSSKEIDWSGFYGGFFVGRGTLQATPTADPVVIAQDALPNHYVTQNISTLIRFKNTNSTQMLAGVFGGYNVVWDDVVLGLEVDFSRSSFSGKSTSKDHRIFSGAVSTSYYDTKIESIGESSIKDWMTFRGRVGWAAGNFMPFMTAGFAVANLKNDYSTAVTVQEYKTVTVTTNCGQTVCTTEQLVAATGPNKGSIRHSGASYGIAIGAGVDFAYSHNIFLRGEWQYLQFDADNKRPLIDMNLLRIAGAMKF